MPITVAPQSPEESPEPPEPPGTGQGEDEPQEEVDYSGLLSPFEDASDLDDAASDALEAGIVVAEEDPELEHDDDPRAVDVLSLGDFGDALGERIDAESVTADDDAAGPLAPADSLDLESNEPAEADDGEGVLEPLDALLGADLPALDVRGDGEEGLGDEPFVLSSFDTEPPPPAERPWVAVRPVTASGPRTVVVQLGTRTIAAGSDVVEFRDDGTAHTIVAASGQGRSGTITSLVSCPGAGTLLLATQSGLLLRADPSTEGAAPVLAWRDAGAIAAKGALSLSLGGPTPSTRPALLLRIGDVGALLESTDQGVTFRRVDLGGRVTVLGTGEPPLCVVEADGARRLMRSEPSGGFVQVGRGLPRAVDVVAIRSEADLAVLLDSAGSVHVSADGGVTFRRSDRCAGATAIAVGHVGGRPCAFAALLDPSEARTTLVLIDGRSGDARTIAHIEVAAEDEDSDETARVASIAWDEHTGTLWAAGSFGMRRFRSPPSA